jgi:FkbM family methyltransferase
MTLAKFEESIRCIAKSQVWYRDDSSLFSNELKIQETKKLLFDKESINILDSVVSFRQNLSSDTFFAGDASSQYFPNDIPWMDAIDSFRFIDGGSFTGDTLEHLVKISDKFDKKIDQVTLFEPDSNNLKDLNSLCESYAGKFEYYIYPCGLWNKNEVLHFSMNSSSGCIVHDNLSLDNDIVSIMGVSIDSTLFGARPNFIKMDIEGAERDAIKGAKETIEKYSPILAIAIYHRPDDLWSIPLLINQINPNYDMYIRSHGNFTLETILYAIPKNK